MSEAERPNSETINTAPHHTMESIKHRRPDLFIVNRMLADDSGRHETEIDPSDRRKAAKAYADSVGHEGRTGGWIYRSSDRDAEAICQGWDEYANRFSAAILDHIAKSVTGQEFKELIEVESLYRPTFRTYGWKRGWRQRLLADAYDQYHERVGSWKRAYRGSDSDPEKEEIAQKGTRRFADLLADGTDRERAYHLTRAYVRKLRVQ